MAAESSTRAVRFSQTDEDFRIDRFKNTRLHIPGADPDAALALGDATMDIAALEADDELGSLARYTESNSRSGSMSSLVAAQVANGVGGQPRQRGSSGGSTAGGIGSGGVGGSDTAGGVPVYANGGTTPARPQRPTAPARTPSSTYAPQRRPQQAPTFINLHDRPQNRSSSAHRTSRDPQSKFRREDRAYVQRIRQDLAGEYFDPYSNPATGGNVDYGESDSEGETPSSEGHLDDRYNQETILFASNDSVQPTEQDLMDPASRERLEWHGMLEAVLTGDVVRQEKKRIIGSADQQMEKSARTMEMWLALRAKVCGRGIHVQRKLVEDARASVDKKLDEIIAFKVKGESEVGKPAIEQVRDVVRSLEKLEMLYPSWQALKAEHAAASLHSFEEARDAIISWYNTNEMINTELSILKKWVGNDELDFLSTKQRSPGASGLNEEASFIDRLMKEDGLKSLHDDDETAKKDRLICKSMLRGITTVIKKAKRTLIDNNSAFEKRHLPPYIEELLTLVSFPSRLIEEIVKLRLAYARKMKESAQANVMMQEQLISQFQVLLKLAIQIKLEYLDIYQSEPGWDLPPCIDESFDQVVLEALRFYFKMLNWKLTGNKNTFKEAELLFQEWDFANEIGRYLAGGDIEVAESFSSLTYKALNRLSSTFERELQRKPKETVAEMTKRYKQLLDSVRVRQRMLQRFSRMLSENYENAADYSIAFGPEKLQELYDRLVESGHFQIYAPNFEQDGLVLIASPALEDRQDDIAGLLGAVLAGQIEDGADSYILIMRPETPQTWYGRTVDLGLRNEMTIDLKLGQLRLIAGGSQIRLANTRQVFLDAVDMDLDLLVEQRSNLHKVNTRLTETRKVAYKLSNAFMDSVAIIRQQTKGLDCQELVQTCFVYATEFGQRSLLYMDSNRRQMNNLKLTNLALEWVSFICDDCSSSDRRTFRWAVQALEFVTGMTHGRHILVLSEDEYSRLKGKVAGCMSLLISHFDIMGARSNLAAQAEKIRLEAQVGQVRRLDQKRLVDDEEAFKFLEEQRLAKLSIIDENRRQKDAERQALGRVLEASSEVDRSLAYLSSSASNVTIRWQQGHFVGGGTFGNVYAAMNLDTGHLMAVKEIRLQGPKLIPTIAEQIRDEMLVLEVLDHPNIVSYYGIEVHRDRVYIFMEFCSGGSLAGLLEHGRIEDEQVIMVYALQLLEGLAYLHESGIAHRDIKPESKYRLNGGAHGRNCDALTHNCHRHPARSQRNHQVRRFRCRKSHCSSGQRFHGRQQREGAAKQVDDGHAHVHVARGDQGREPW